MFTRVISGHITNVLFCRRTPVVRERPLMTVVLRTSLLLPMSESGYTFDYRPVTPTTHTGEDGGDGTPVSRAEVLVSVRRENTSLFYFVLWGPSDPRSKKSIDDFISTRGTLHRINFITGLGGVTIS